MKAISMSCRRAWFALLAALSLLAGCDDESLVAEAPIVRVLPDTLDFGPVFLGEHKNLEVELENGARSAVTVEIASSLPNFIAQPDRISIAPGQRATLRIRFAPEQLGAAEGTVLVQLPGGAKREVRVSGVGAEREIEVVPEVDFGLVRVGTEGSRDLEVSSRSDLPLWVEARIGGEDAEPFRAAAASLSLAPGETGQLHLSYGPLATGEHTALLLLRLCAGCDEQAVVLRGEGAAQSFDVSPAAVDFGTVEPGEHRSQVVTITNDGGFDAHLMEIALLRGAGVPFSADLPATPHLLTPGESLQLEILYDPVTEGSYGATLRVQVGGETREVPILGRSRGALLAANPPSIDFGVQPGGLSVTRQVVLHSVGSRAVDVETIVFEGDEASFRMQPSAALPTAVDDEPLILDVTFEATEERAHGGQIVVANEEDGELIRIDVAGDIRSQQPCELAIAPRSLRFGAVKVGDTDQRTVRVINQGLETCTVWDMRLADDTAAAFAVTSELPRLVDLAPQEEYTVDVAYAPLAAGIEPDRGSLRLQAFPPDSAPIEIALSGFATDLDLILEPQPVDFGQQPLGSSTLRSLHIRNPGPLVVRVTGVTLAAGTFEIGQRGNYPSSVPVGSNETVHLGFVPVSEGAVAAELEVWVDEIPEPFLATLQGEGLDVPCGDACLQPQASCPGDASVYVHSTHHLDGAAQDGDGSAVDCSWTVESAPAGSVASADPATACATTFRPDKVGTFQLRLTAEDADGNLDSCDVTVEAMPLPALWIETVWDSPDDVDLHLVHPDAGPMTDLASWFHDPYDCYFGNMAPHWDGASAADDPALDRDDQSGTGPEAMRMTGPITGQSYGVGVHWFSSTNGNQTLDITTRVYCGGVLAGEATVTLDHQNAAAIVGELEFDTATSCTFRPDGTKLTLLP